MKKSHKTTKIVCANASWSTGCQYVFVRVRARKKRPLQNSQALIVTVIRVQESTVEANG